MNHVGNHVGTEESARSPAHDARESMARLGIPDTPQNFWVWYTYHAHVNPNLNRAINILLSNHREFTEQTNEEIFEQYLGTAREHQVIRETTHRVAATLDALSEFVNEASARASSYKETLEDLASQVVAGKPLPALLDMLMSETETIEQQNQLLQQRLLSSSSTIDQLRRNLEDVRRDALTDALTGIANRKLFDSTLREAAMQVMETGADLCLLMIDIDHFKKFNDTFGHQTGDDVLKFVAKSLVANLRAADTPARYGGEEFAAILPGVSLEEAETAAQRIRQAFETKNIVDRKTGQDIGAITVSVGVALFEPGETLAAFVKRADEALYAAKRQGRNAVVAAGSGMN